MAERTAANTALLQTMSKDIEELKTDMKEVNTWKGSLKIVLWIVNGFTALAVALVTYWFTSGHGPR